MIASKTLLWCARLLALVLLASPAMADEAVPLVRTKTDTYTNVTLVSHNTTHVFVQHSRGMATLKVADLNKDALIGLGVIPDDRVSAAVVEPQGGESSVSNWFSASEATEEGDAATEVAAMGSMPPQVQESVKVAAAFLRTISVAFVIGLLAFAVLMVIFYSFCVKRICEKSGVSTGWWIWIPIPVIQQIALFRAAHMSPYWVLHGVAVNVAITIAEKLQAPPATQLGIALAWLLLVVVLHIVWSVRLCNVRGKGWFAMLCLIFPLTYPFAFLYMAFSDGAAEREEETPRISFEPLPA